MAHQYEFDTFGYSSQEVKEFRKHFQRIDRDGDGHITINELRNLFKEMKVRVTARTLNDLIAEVDTNRNGQVEFDEFLQLMFRLKKGGSTNWKKLLDFTKPDEGDELLKEAKKETYRFLGATSSVDFDGNQQWQNYSFFDRIDQPANRGKGGIMGSIPFLNPKQKQQAQAPKKGPILPSTNGGRPLKGGIKVNILKNDEEVSDGEFHSDTSYEYYSDSSDDDGANAKAKNRQSFPPLRIASPPPRISSPQPRVASPPSNGSQGQVPQQPLHPQSQHPQPQHPQPVHPQPVHPQPVHPQPQHPQPQGQRPLSQLFSAPSPPPPLSNSPPPLPGPLDPRNADYEINQHRLERLEKQHELEQRRLQQIERQLSQARDLQMALQRPDRTTEIPLIPMGQSSSSGQSPSHSPSHSPIHSSKNSPVPVAPILASVHQENNARKYAGAAERYGYAVDDTDDFISEPSSPVGTTHPPHPRPLDRQSSKQNMAAQAIKNLRTPSQKSIQVDAARPPSPSSPSTPSSIITPASTTSVSALLPPSHHHQLSHNGHPVIVPDTILEVQTPDNTPKGARTKGRKKKTSHDRPLPQRRKTTLKGAKMKKVDSVLQDPKVRQQLEKQKIHKPFLTLAIIFAELVIMIYALVANNGFESFLINPFAGPSVQILIQLGAKYAPCMREATLSTLEPFGITSPDDYIPCPEGYEGPQNGTECTYYDAMEYVCGMGGFFDGFPNQWWRFISAMFVHAGLIQLVVVLLFQLRIALRLEQEIGALRLYCIYFCCGILGNAFAATMSPLAVTCGGSGALFGLFALLFIDLFQNWPLLIAPWRNLTGLLVICLLVLGVGLLPFIDNYAQIAGFIGGLLAGLIFMPTITFGVWDGRTKRILLLISIPVLALLYFGAFYTFYDTGKETSYCRYCTYLDCVPPDFGWCDATAGYF